MKAAIIIHRALGLFICSFLFFCFALPQQQTRAQDNVYQESTLDPSEKYSREELAQMLAPIALYPDALLSQVLMASTYPIEVIEADRWLRKNSGLKGDSLDTALLEKDWDPSVKAICHFPSVLAVMSERITETTNIGNAFLAQETEVMNMVQELRAKAYAQGNLVSNSQQKVIVEKETIIIEPANPRVIYVPYYDPFYIYGPWWFPAYPPFYWGPVGVSLGIGISYWPAFHFGFVFGNWSYFDWHHHHIVLVVHERPHFVRRSRWIRKSGRWHHLPRHRRGVAYRDKHTARKYGQAPPRSRDFRRDTRGYPARPDRDRIQRRDDRSRIDRSRQDDTRSKIERGKPVRKQQEPARIIRERQKPSRVERERKEGVSIRPERQRVDRGKTIRRERTYDRSRDNVFNRVEEGRQERRSSERGKFSRQGRDKEPRGRGRTGDEDRGRGGGRGRNRR